MAKLLSLLLCCTLFAGSVWAQPWSNEAVLSQKLQFKKANLGWTANTNYFAKKNIDPYGDDTRSMMFLGKPKQNSLNMQLPEVKHRKMDVQIKAGPHQPLFRSQ